MQQHGSDATAGGRAVAGAAQRFDSNAGPTVRNCALGDQLLKPDGVLVYSTCSLEPEENEQLVERLLTEFPHIRFLQKVYSLPFRDHFDGAFAGHLINTG